MALKHLPPTFCWSRIGAEAGADLPTLVLRKEWERRQGGGRFLWGIGQSLGSSAQVAALRTGSLLALFSAAASRARGEGRRGQKPDVLVWNAWVDAGGQVRQLPQHVFVTSAATLPSGAAREQHYALVCVSPTELSVGSSLRVHPERLRSVSTGKAPSPSQGTVVVDCIERAGEAGGKHHPLVFTAELEAPYFVRLTQPTLVKARELAAINEASRMGDFETYADLTRRQRSKPLTLHSRGYTRDLFDVPPADHASSRLGARKVSFAGDWTQLTMELLHGDSHPFARSRGCATLF
ncbi:hypothetical protein [Paraburkholderia acidisoli]|uniref:Uncharacterized protein n=1 Tax=Paraburkholderia acidisoli TaxID=2571748 RepID=A0A7Z2JJ65_9BURK|nr:hypothetical protein [Paraburkholderia acidisoli]QGZ65888.1 hypothetical protein FAZ98_29035 [Paraburkholderia acidisoli]